MLEAGSLRLGSFELHWNGETPLYLDAKDTSVAGRSGVSLVEVFSAHEQRARTSQAYYLSSIGARLRYSSGGVLQRSAAEDSATFVQRDAATGIEVETLLTAPHGMNVLRVVNTVSNGGDAPVVITAVSSATLGFGQSEAHAANLRLALAESEWLAENRWNEQLFSDWSPWLSLPIHAQDGRGHLGWTSHGSWSTGERLPVGVLSDLASGHSVAWQIETSAGWHMDLCQTARGGVLSLLGPADLEHHFAHTLQPGDRFDAVPAAIAVSAGGRDGALAELTAYRRWLRRNISRQGLPVVYNDFMNTLMGQPSTAALLPLVRQAAAAGVEVFCIDAGWFADPAIGDWWATVGEWREAPTRFDTGGLKAVIDEIHRLGMRSGIWLEPEVVGVHSPVASSLPDEAFFVRFGQRVREHDRYHLDLRHPAARAHVDETVDRLISQYGVSYFKLDYNINPGVGTERNATGAGAGLLAHTRALQQWAADLNTRHPSVAVENCSSGAMRADYALLAVTHMQSTSDQQDYERYPTIAASAPASILPEQCANWAYPAHEMNDEQTAFTLVTGLSGRLYLSGFLDRLRADQSRLIREAVELNKETREFIASATPFWPLGLPGWSDEVVCLGLRGEQTELIFVWDRSADPARIVLPGVMGSARLVFPVALPEWKMDATQAGLALTTASGIGARVFDVSRHLIREMPHRSLEV
ncbi:glycoside hydrolase family 36 protein [Microbacterium sp. R86528]|uniref:glycoside hydrolase family 36 protein n=1 Tax=Microbacterium sp. R86528 TaxID=3093864 RepID=UPI0037C87553